MKAIYLALLMLINFSVIAQPKILQTNFSEVKVKGLCLASNGSLILSGSAKNTDDSISKAFISKSENGLIKAFSTESGFNLKSLGTIIQLQDGNFLALQNDINNWGEQYGDNYFCFFDTELQCRAIYNLPYTQIINNVIQQSNGNIVFFSHDNYSESKISILNSFNNISSISVKKFPFVILGYKETGNKAFIYGLEQISGIPNLLAKTVVAEVDNNFNIIKTYTLMYNEFVDFRVTDILLDTNSNDILMSGFIFQKSSTVAPKAHFLKMDETGTINYKRTVLNTVSPTIFSDIKLSNNNIVELDYSKNTFNNSFIDQSAIIDLNATDDSITVKSFNLINDINNFPYGISYLNKKIISNNDKYSVNTIHKSSYFPTSGYFPIISPEINNNRSCNIHTWTEYCPISSSYDLISSVIPNLTVTHSTQGAIGLMASVNFEDKPFENFDACSNDINNLEPIELIESGVFTVNEPNNFNIAITSNQLNIHGNKVIKSIDILDISSKIWLQQKNNTNFIQCNLYNLSKGIYFVKIQSENNSIETHKIILN